METFIGLQNFPQLVASPLFPLLLTSLRTQKYSPVTTNEYKKEYDYIVVGAGSTGSVVASRLSEKPCASVLLLEAGGQPPLITEIPGIKSAYFTGEMFWNFTTVPQKRTGLASPNRQSTYVLGRTLGGSSSINSMIYTRGNRHNFDEWASLGAKGWSYDEVLPYFKKLEDNVDPEYVASGFHASGGPVTASRPNYYPDIEKLLLETALEMGYDFGDSNGGKQYGFDDFQLTVRKGQRCSTAKAYLVFEEERPNLDIVTGAMVTKILFKDRRAVGVQFERNGTLHEVAARKEIIVSAGAIGTPVLLMLSGIGPEEHLTKLKIPVVADLPVGSNFHGHISSNIYYQLNGSLAPLKERFSNNRSISDYIYKRKGPLASGQAIHGMAFLSANDTGKLEDKPDYELVFVEAHPELIKGAGFDKKIYDHVFGPHEDKAIFTCFAFAINPKSRGTIRLRTSDPKDPPEVDPNIFEDPQDFEDLLEGMKNCYKILTSPTMSNAGVKVLSTTGTGCKTFSDDLEESLRCYLRSFAHPSLHIAGSAKMGDLSDPSTVVDPQLRVKSIEGLRIADASIMPKVTWGHTNVPCIMIGEKASDMIKENIACGLR